jgi:hypothetical protein
MAAPGPKGGSRPRGGTFAMERKPVGRRTRPKPPHSTRSRRFAFVKGRRKACFGMRSRRRSALTYPPSRQGQQQMVAPPSLWHLSPVSGSIQVWMRLVWSYRQPCRTMHRL